MKDESAPEPTVPRRWRGVNGLPDDLIDYSKDDDAVGGSHDDELAQPSSIDEPPRATPHDEQVRADSVVKPPGDDL
jgi:hypothetical protein